MRYAYTRRQKTKKRRTTQQISNMLLEEYCSADTHDLDPAFSFHR